MKINNTTLNDVPTAEDIFLLMTRPKSEICNGECWQENKNKERISECTYLEYCQEKYNEVH